MIKKFDKIRYIDTETSILRAKDVIVEEKYDGSNGRITYHDGSFWYGTRNVIRKEENLEKFQDQFLDYFVILKDRIHYSENYKTIKKILKEIVLFFEMCGRHNILKIVYNKKIKFVVFDAWDKIEEKYISTDHPHVKFLIKELKLEKARRLPINSYLDAKDWIYQQDPKEIEGVVIKDYENDKRVKVLHPQNSEIESAIFTKMKDSSYYVESKFIHKYVTENRIKKIMNRLKAYHMENISKVLKELHRDLIIECLPHYILSENIKGISIEYLKKNVPKVSVPILKELIMKRVEEK